MFQSPLHRGLGSDLGEMKAFVLSQNVSIPSSSGPGFGRCSEVLRREECPFQSPLHRGLGSDHAREPDCEAAQSVRFNPLFIGAWVRTIVSLLNLLEGVESFNPLFIGAWVRTGTSLGSRPTAFRFNPLFIGAWVRTY